jgi:hypothetical protein
MNPEFLKAAGSIFGAVVALPFLYMIWRAGSFFGAFRKTVESMEQFIKHATGKIDDHEDRLARIEEARKTELRMEREYGRRHQARRNGDPPPADEPLD